MKTVCTFIWLFCIVIYAQSVHAYSYATTGKDALIEAREAVLKAVNEKEFDIALSTVSQYGEEFRYLDEHHHPGLLKELNTAINNKEENRVFQVLNQFMVAEIQRRLNAAESEFTNYQIARVLVLRSKKIYDLISVGLSSQQRLEGEHLLKKCLHAVGKPGVFGVGSVPSDLKLFKSNKIKLFELLSELK